MTNQQRLTHLKTKFGADSILLAEAFIAQNLKALRLRKNSKIYVAAVEYFAVLFETNQQPLTPNDLLKLKEDDNKKVVGKIHQRLKTRFEELSKVDSLVYDARRPPDRERIPAQGPLPNPSRTQSQTRTGPLKLNLFSNAERVPKGGTVTLTWTSQNAKRVRKTNIPGVKVGSNQVNGTAEVENIRRKRDFYIVVEGGNNQTKESRVTTLIETQAFLQGKEDKQTSSSSQRTTRPPRQSSGSTSSQSSAQQTQQEEEPKVGSNSNFLSINILSSIDKSLTGILSVLKSQFKINETFLARQRKLTEEERRALKEKQMETPEKASDGLKMMKEGAEKMISPFKFIIDKIVNFLVYTFLGRAFTEITEWFNDPQNKDKVQAMGRFLKDFWPLIAGVAVWFLTPFGGFVTGTVKFIRGTIKTLKALGGAISRVIMKTSGKVASTAAKGGAKAVLSKAATSGPVSKIASKIGGKTLAKAVPLLGTGIAAYEGTSRLLSGDIEGAMISYAGGIPVLGWGAVALDAYRELDPEGYKKNIRAGMSVEEINKVLSDAFGTVGSSMMGGPSLMNSGGQIFSGLVTKDTGTSVKGAGKDTQMFPVMGGGAAVLQPGEVVLQPKAVGKLLKIGIDPLSLNEGPNANKPKTIGSNNISLMNTGGVVGNPNISMADYNALLAIAALEADRPQGRADVAQSIYNRLHAASKYGMNFMQRSNTIKDLILAKDQYQPTFSNSKDWTNIGNDIKSAAIAVMNSQKGKRYKWTLDDAMKQIRATEKAIRDQALQRNAMQLVKGLPSFRGTSEQSYMRPDLGDVLRDKTSNFFTPYGIEKTPYFNERINKPAPIPKMLLPKVQVTPQVKQPKQTNPIMDMLGKIQGLFGKRRGGLISSTSGDELQGRPSDSIVARLEKGEYVVPKVAVAKIGTDILDRVSSLDPNSNGAMRVAKMDLNIPTPRPISSARPQMSMETLPPIMQGSNAPMSAGSGTPIPTFSATTAEHIRSANAAIYGIV